MINLLQKGSKSDFLSICEAKNPMSVCTHLLGRLGSSAVLCNLNIVLLLFDTLMSNRIKIYTFKPNLQILKDTSNIVGIIFFLFDIYVIIQLQSKRRLRRTDRMPTIII